MTHSNNRGLLFIGNFLSASVGTRAIGEELADRFAKRGWSVYTASGKTNKLLRLLEMLITTLRLRKLYKLVTVDVFSGQAFLYAELVTALLRLLQKKHIIVLHGGGLFNFYQKHPKRVQYLIIKADNVVTPSKFLRENFSTIRSEIIWIPNGIELDAYPFKHRTNPQPGLIWLRAFHAIYSPAMAVEVLYLLKDKFPTMTLTMVGPDKQDGTFDHFMAKVEEYQLGEQVKIIGKVPKKEVPYWLNQGDIFLNTTRVESFGVAVLEAAACGLPIVTTTAGELPYFWEDEEDALLVPPDDAAAMAQAVERILTEPGLAGRLSANARKKAEGFDWSVVLPQWEALFFRSRNGDLC